MGDPSVMNLLQYVQTFAILIGGGWALVQFGLAVGQRKKEQKWRRAQLAWTLTDQIHESKAIVPLLQLIDKESDRLRVGGDIIYDADIDEALRFTGKGKFPDTSPKAREIREYFDALFYALERLDHARRLGLISAAEVFPPTKYYARIIAEHPNYLAYARCIEYMGAANLVENLARTKVLGRKLFTAIAVVALAALAALQLLRIFAGWEVTLNGGLVPLWLSALVAAIAAGLAVMVWRERSS